MKFGPFFFLNRLVANKTIPTIKAIINTLKAKKDKMAKPKIIQNAKANLVVKGIFCLGPSCWNINILLKKFKNSFNFQCGFVMIGNDRSQPSHHTLPPMWSQK